MKAAISVIALAVCSGGSQIRGSQLRNAPSKFAKIVTATFAEKLKNALERTWYVPEEKRLSESEVYQLSEERIGNPTNLMADYGWGIHHGRMTQYKFSLIGENKNCVIGITNSGRFGDKWSFLLGLDLSSGAFVGAGPATSVKKEFGKDSDDIDWFFEHHQNGFIKAFVTLNGEPLGMVFKMSDIVIGKNQFDARMRPLLQCKGQMGFDKGIAVTQYSATTIPSDRPYVSGVPSEETQSVNVPRDMRKEIEIQMHYELQNVGIHNLPENITKNLKIKTFPKDFSMKLTVKGYRIQLRAQNTIACSVRLLENGKINGLIKPNEKLCWISLNEVEETYSSLERILARFMMNMIAYHKPSDSDDLILYSPGFGAIKFTPYVGF